jgi:hypothetical protein
MTLTKEEQDKLAKQLRQEYQAGLDFRLRREKAWKQAEDQYFNRVTKSLKQRYNVPVPIIPGFVETLLSKIDDPPALKFDPREEADYKATMKANSFYQAESTAEDHDWDLIDLDAKKQAILYGRGIKKFFSESEPEYKSNLEVVDVYDFYCDPIGGGNLEKHRFAGQDNIFRTKQELKAGAESGLYEKTAVEKLINATSADRLVDNDNVYRSKQSRMMALGMDGITFNFAGQDLYKFIEAGTMWNGQRYYVLFNYETGAIIRCAPLKEVFKSNLWPWVSWATHRDIFNFWSKAPVDDILPLAEMVKTLVNQELDNRQKKNWGQRAYDPEVFPEPSQLEWRPDGLVRMKSGSSRVQRIDQAVYSFETPELKGTIDMVAWIDGIIGQKSGVTADTQGSSKEDKVGIYYGNMQQVADRLGLYNKSYQKAWAAIGRRYLWGLFEHLRSPQAVQIIGEKGNEWDEIVRMEISPYWNIKVEGGNAQMAADEVKKQKRAEALSAFTIQELAVVSPKWLAEQRLRNAEFPEEELKSAFDIQGDADKELMSEASMAIQEIIAGKQPRPNRGATPAFVQKILDYATDNTDNDDALFAALIAYAQLHKPIIAENMARKASMMMATSGVQMPGMTPAPMAPAAAPNTFGGTASASQQVSPNIAA